MSPLVMELAVGLPFVAMGITIFVLPERVAHWAVCGNPFNFNHTKAMPPQWAVRALGVLFTVAGSILLLIFSSSVVISLVTEVALVWRV